MAHVLIKAGGLFSSKPGDLVRIITRGNPVLAIAATGNTQGNVDRVFMLAQGGPYECYMGDDCDVICYGSDYTIDESEDADAFQAQATVAPGSILLRNSDAGGLSATLVCKEPQGAVRFLDLGSGRCAGRPGGMGLDLMKWRILIGAPGERREIFRWE